MNQKSRNFHNWAHATTCHGVADFWRSKLLISKLFWISLLATCLGMAFWHIGELMMRFWSKPHYVTSTFQEETDFAVFPNVTVCNFNRAHRERAILAGMVNESGSLDPDLLNYLFLSFPGHYDAAMFEDEFFWNLTYGYKMLAGMREKYQRWQKGINQTDISPVELIKHLGYRCREMMNDCFWKGHKFDCCSRAKPVVNVYGLCHSITPPIEDGDLTAKQKIAGLLQGLTIDVDSQLDTYTVEVVKYNFMEAGILVNVNYDPYEMTMTNPIGISPNKKAWIALRGKRRYSKEPMLKIFKKDCYDLKLDILKGVYTRSTCISECYLKAQLEMCNCIAVAEVQDSGLKYCDGYEYLGCFIAGFYSYTYPNINNKYEVCMKLCERLPCQERLGVDASVSTATRMIPGRGKFIKHRVLSVLDNHKSDEELKAYSDLFSEHRMNGFISVNVFFSEISRLAMEKNEKIPIFDLISNVGGQLGLWLGMSLISIIQAVYYLMATAFKQQIGDTNHD